MDYVIEQTETFTAWLALRVKKDRSTGLRITQRIGRLRLGNFGDMKSVGDGVSELRLDIGPGYRIYFTQRGQRVVVLLCGGDKSTQKREDVDKAKEMARSM